MAFTEKPPILRGSEQEQLNALRDYLFRMASSLNSGGATAAETAGQPRPNRSGGSQVVTDPATIAEVRKNAQALKALILKSARQVQNAANAYTDSVSDTAAQTYVPKVDYEGFIDGVEKRIDEKAKAAEDAAKGYADGKASGAESTAKSYADGKIASAAEAAQSYADGKAASAESAAKTYADGQVSAAEEALKKYTDGSVQSSEFGIREYVDKKDETYESLFVAKSEYGTFAESIDTRIETTARGVVESYDYDAAIHSQQDSINLLQNYMTSIDGEIRRGVVEDPDTGEYVTGIAISQSLKFSGECGPTDSNNPQDGFQYYYLASGQTFGLYTSTGWQFWIDGYKKGWFDSVDGMLHVANIVVENTLQLGSSWQLRGTNSEFELVYIGD